MVNLILLRGIYSKLVITFPNLNMIHSKMMKKITEEKWWCSLSAVVGFPPPLLSVFVLFIGARYVRTDM